MNNRVFLFDLDATVTKEEILPALAEQVGLLEEMREMTEKPCAEKFRFKAAFWRGSRC